MFSGPIVLARFGVTKWMVGGSFLGLVAVSVVALLGLVVLGVVVRWVRSRGPSSLRKLGYRPAGGGKYVRKVDKLEVEFHPPRRWTTRLALYGTVDLSLEPRAGRPPPEDGFVTGDELLDDRFSMWSDRPPFAKQVLDDVHVRDALLALPNPSLVLRGDELVVELPRPGPAAHDQIADLARAIGARAGQRNRV